MMPWGSVRTGWSLALSGGRMGRLQEKIFPRSCHKHAQLGMIASGSSLSLSFQCGKDVNKVLQVLVVHN
jgi:hypothetical protein